jgi:urease accessory protein UreH
MRIPLSNVGRSGRLELTFALQNGQTRLRDAYCEVPFKVTRVLNSPQRVAHLILMQCTAGLFGGDDVDCEIRVESGARVRITQQSATKVHPSQDRRVSQRHRIFVEPRAELQLYLEPVIPFANSRLRQSMLLDVAQGGMLYFWEGFMTGRVGRGEAWQFREFASETQLYSDGRLAYLDRFHLLPDSLPRSAWAMGNHNYSGTGLYVGERAGDVASKLHQILPEAGVDSLSDYVTAARVVSPSGPNFHHCRDVFCRLADLQWQPDCSTMECA